MKKVLSGIALTLFIICWGAYGFLDSCTSWQAPVSNPLAINNPTGSIKVYKSISACQEAFIKHRAEKCAKLLAETNQLNSGDDIAECVYNDMQAQPEYYKAKFKQCKEYGTF